MVRDVLVGRCRCANIFLTALPDRSELNTVDGMMKLRQSLAHMYFFYLVRQPVFPAHFTATAGVDLPVLRLRTRYNEDPFVDLDPYCDSIGCYFAKMIAASESSAWFDVKVSECLLTAIVELYHACVLQLDLRDGEGRKRSARVAFLYFPCSGMHRHRRV